MLETQFFVAYVKISNSIETIPIYWGLPYVFYHAWSEYFTLNKIFKFIFNKNYKWWLRVKSLSNFTLKTRFEKYFFFFHDAWWKWRLFTPTGLILRKKKKAIWLTYSFKVCSGKRSNPEYVLYFDWKYHEKCLKLFCIINYKIIEQRICLRISYINIE